MSRDLTLEQILRAAPVMPVIALERLEQALRMNRSMRDLMATGFRDRHPEWTEPRVRQAVAERILHARTG